LIEAGGNSGYEYVFYNPGQAVYIVPRIQSRLNFYDVGRLYALIKNDLEIDFSDRSTYSARFFVREKLTIDEALANPDFCLRF
jgi:uncharacterized linocin/CFP29 family protein